MKDPTQRSSLPSRLAALLLESAKLFSIAVTCLIIFALVIFTSIKTGIVIPWRWCALSIWTGFMIWMLCRQYKHNLKRVKYWFTLFCLVLAHVVAFVVILRWYPEWPMIWYWPVALVEVPCMAIVLDIALNNTHHRRR
jgi:hypothetical protein